MGDTIATNKKAYRDYILSDKIECGIELIGSEVKSIRAGNVSFTDSFGRVEKGQVFIYNLHIESYQSASYMNKEPARLRRLLLHKKQINKLEVASIQGGLAIVPTKIYLNERGFVKLEIALGKGKKLYDKRDDIKKRDTDRSIRRTMNARNQR